MTKKHGVILVDDRRQQPFSVYWKGILYQFFAKRDEAEAYWERLMRAFAAEERRAFGLEKARRPE